MHMVQVAGIVGGSVFKWEYFEGSTHLWKTLPSLSDGTNPGGGSPGPLQQNGSVSWTFLTTDNWIACYPTTSGNLGPDDTFNKLRMWIRLRIDSTGPVFTTPKPTGDYCSLPPGLGYVYLYCHDGSGTLPASVKTSVESAVELYRGCGITVDVREPYLVQPTITLTVTVAANYDPTEIDLKVTQYLLDWLSTKVLGEDLYVAEIYHKVMGLDEKAIHNCDITLPSEDIVVPSSSVIRPNASYITVNTILES